MDWQDSALCSKHDPELWFPETYNLGQGWLAKKICSECPVKIQCLEYAMTNRIVFGIWGGLTPQDRHRMHRQKGGLSQPRTRGGLFDEAAARRSFQCALAIGVMKTCREYGVDRMTLYRAWDKYGLDRQQIWFRTRKNYPLVHVKGGQP